MIVNFLEIVLNLIRIKIVTKNSESKEHKDKNKNNNEEDEEDDSSYIVPDGQDVVK